MRTTTKNIINGNFKVYCHLSKTNNKLYFGITSQTLNARWRKGKGYKKGVFYRAIQKYGWDNFEHILLLDNLNEDCAKEIEKYLIKKYNSVVPFGYNTTLGGDSVYRHVYTEEERQLRSQRMTGKNNPMYGIRLTGENNPMYGKHLSDSTKEKIGRAHIGNTYKRGTVLSKESKKRISQLAKERFKDKRNHPMYGKIGNKHHLYGKEGIGKKSVVLTNTGEIFDSVTSASVAYGITPTEVSRCCHFRQKSAGKDADGKKLFGNLQMYNITIGGIEHCIY